MIYFTSHEILVSVISAVIYGIVFGLFYSLISDLSKIPAAVLAMLKEGVLYKGRIFSKPQISVDEANSGVFNTVISVLKTAFTIFSFSLGFFLLSYWALDGVIRIYMLVLSLASDIITVKLSGLTLRKLWSLVFTYFELLTIYMLRIITFPFRTAILRLILIVENAKARLPLKKNEKPCTKKTKGEKASG